MQAVLDSHAQKCARLEAIQWSERKLAAQALSALVERQRAGLTRHERLSARLESVAAKVLYLGDQLEGVNTPRARALEAFRLMERFARVLQAGKAPDDEDEDLLARADTVNKLALIAAELPQDTRFEAARTRIAQSYAHVETRLIDEFVLAHRRDDRARMREMARVLALFKGYNQCVDAFIETAHAQLAPNHVFEDIPALCARNEPLVRHVFPDPEHVMSKLVLNVFYGRLQEEVSARLTQAQDERHLALLEELFAKTQKMARQLHALLGPEQQPFLAKVTRQVFHKFLQNYDQLETRVLRDKCQLTLARFYESAGHVRRATWQSSYLELKRDLTAKIQALPLVSGPPPPPEADPRRLLSEEVAVALLQDTKVALARAHVLARPHDLPGLACALWATCLHFLCAQHLEYALDAGLAHADAQNASTCFRLLESARAVTAVVHLLEKQFQDAVLPLVSGHPKHGEALKLKRAHLDQLEARLNLALERTLAAAQTHVRHLLAQEQRKTDFRPEEDAHVATATAACHKVVKFVRESAARLRDSLDGRNVEAALHELGLRFHRALVEHLLGFTFSSSGAMVAIQDLDHYRRCAQDLRVPLLTRLFDALHELCNLLVVAPDNLRHAMEQAIGV